MRKGKWWYDCFLFECFYSSFYDTKGEFTIPDGTVMFKEVIVAVVSSNKRADDVHGIGD